MNIKSLLVGGLLPLVAMLDAAAGKAVADAQKALEDSKLSEPEAVGIACDCIDVAIEHWPAGVTALESLKQNLIEDLPGEEKIVQNVERTIWLFKAIGQPATA